MAGFSFGGTPSGSSFSFGAKTTASAAPGFSLGTNVQSSPFGATNTGTGNLGFGNLGQTNVSSSGNTFGLSFGAPTTTTPASGGFGLQTPQTTLGGFGLSTPGTTTQPSTNFSLGSFGTTPASQPQQSTGLGNFSTFSQPGGLGTAGTTSSGFLGLQTSTTASKPLLGTAPPLALPNPGSTAVSSSFVGLGGIDVSQNKVGQSGSTSTPSDNKAAKETQLPNEILQTVHDFESFMKQQKLMSSEIGRGSVKPLHKVQEETEALKQALASIDNALNRNAALVEKLKTEGAKELQNAEMAQRTHETPAGLQLENSTPLEYFTGLVTGFERDMQTLRQEIENAERHLHNQMQPIALTPQELTVSLRRLHESFVGLAGHLQEVHNTVDQHWEQYLGLRRRIQRQLPPPNSTFTATTSAGRSADISNMETLSAKPGPSPFTRVGINLTAPAANMSTLNPGRSPFGSVVPLGLTATSALQPSLGQQLVPSLPSGGPYGLGSLQSGPLCASAPPYASVANSTFLQSSSPTQGSKRGKR
ncbi:nucleoporin p58/p45 [Ischnura elegans]|uniref:nucleoporin p58/p45 n=1 Tax=Ischnura elegans TaxID=197161 RepID=UPI001ED8B5E9|nr:nucleoporin p58/p45 [Ischnura elegans]